MGTIHADTDHFGVEVFEAIQFYLVRRQLRGTNLAESKGYEGESSEKARAAFKRRNRLKSLFVLRSRESAHFRLGVLALLESEAGATCSKLIAIRL